MKKANVLGLLSLLMVLMMNLTFTSCNKDDDDDVLSKETIVGTWEWVSVKFTVAGISGEEVETMGGTVEFKADGTYNDDGDKGTWVLNGNKLILDEDDEYVANLKGNQLILTCEDEEEGVKFTETYTLQKK